MVWRRRQRQLGDNEQDASNNRQEEAQKSTGSPTDEGEQKIEYKAVKPSVPIGIEDEQKENEPNLKRIS